MPGDAEAEKAGGNRTIALPPSCGISALPGNHEDAWRRIDHDWLGVSADLAIQLDKRTNNSSLVLAFEFVDTKRVLLFVGDAQVGNWLSWKDVHGRSGTHTVTARDLLARTVFYKVGHHGSHNATLKQNGLELMTCPICSRLHSDQCGRCQVGRLGRDAVRAAARRPEEANP